MNAELDPDFQVIGWKLSLDGAREMKVRLLRRVTIGNERKKDKLEGERG